MFEISLRQMKECINSLEADEKEMTNLIKRLHHVYSNFDSLVDGMADKKALNAIIEDVTSQKKGLSNMKNTLIEIVRCYEETEKKLISSTGKTGVRNQFGYRDFTMVAQILDELNISFK